MFRIYAAFGECDDPLSHVPFSGRYFGFLGKKKLYRYWITGSYHTLDLREREDRLPSDKESSRQCTHLVKSLLGMFLVLELLARKSLV